MNRNEKWVQRMKKAVTLLLVVSLVLGSVPANVLAAGSARLNAAIAAADENTQDAPAPCDRGSRGSSKSSRSDPG